MKRIVLTKANPLFDDTFDNVKSLTKDSSLADKYEAILAWVSACAENPASAYMIFAELSNSYKSWKDVEDCLPNITFTKCCDGEIEFNFDAEFENLMILFRVVQVNGANMTDFTNKAFELSADRLEYLQNSFSFLGFNYRQEDDYTLSISHK